jgi:hypothetical protein
LIRGPALLALRAPAVEIIQRSERRYLDGTIGSELRTLAAAQDDRLARTGDDLRLAVAHGDGGVAGAVHGDAVAAGPHQGHGRIGRIDLERAARIRIAQRDVRPAGTDAQAHGGGTQVEQRHETAVGHAQDRASEIDLGTRPAVAPELIAAAQGPIDPRRGPVLDAHRLHRYGALDITDTRRSGGRIEIDGARELLLIGRRLRHDGDARRPGQPQHGQENHEFMPAGSHKRTPGFPGPHHRVGESSCSNARRTSLMGGNPCCMKAS